MVGGGAVYSGGVVAETGALTDLATVTRNRARLSGLLVGWGAVAGLAWSSGMRGFMAQIAGAQTQVHWELTFVWLLLPGALVGALLGWAEYLRRLGGRARLAVASGIPAALFGSPVQQRLGLQRPSREWDRRRSHRRPSRGHAWRPRDLRPRSAGRPPALRRSRVEQHPSLGVDGGRHLPGSRLDHSAWCLDGGLLLDVPRGVGAREFHSASTMPSGRHLAEKACDGGGRPISG